MKNNKAVIAIGIILAIILGIGVFFVNSYNSLVDSEENVSKYYSDIDADLQRRNDLIPNLVESVRAYAKHETEIFTAISDARAKMMQASTPQESANADSNMSSALSRLLAITESYPDLKANQNFIDLQTQLEGTENRIKVARSKYNEATKEFNTKIRKFPNSIIASMMGFDKKEYFEAESGAENVPQVSFE